MRHVGRRSRLEAELSDRPLVAPHPPLANGRVALRTWELADAKRLVDAWNDPEIMHFTEVPAARTLADAETWIAGGATRRLRRLALDLVITSPGSGSVLGEVGFWNFNDPSKGAMLGYWLLKAHRGRGNARAAVELAVDWAMADHGLGLDLLVAKVDRDNEASERLLRGLGFHLERNDVDGHRLFTHRATQAAPEAPLARDEVTASVNPSK